ncbi:MAG: rhamnulokinase [Phycisphaerae bacterium]|nr:rhamnulokinase [Phycisphaerae bacterium]
MKETKSYIAIDLGAESGRIILGDVSSEQIKLNEIHRFINIPVQENDSLRWDFDLILTEIKRGISKAVNATEVKISGIAVDSWGVDFGLLDTNGKLIENPYHYRDSRTDGIPEKAFEIMPLWDIFQNSGTQFMKINSLFQLLALKHYNPELLNKVSSLIFMADLVSYHLCGQQFAEYSLASTSQLMDISTGKWSQTIFDKLSLPVNIMPTIVQPGTIVGKLQGQICKELNIDPIDIIAVGSHDTASAVMAIPASQSASWAYISSGTWSLMGIEADSPVINKDTFEQTFTNEGGVCNKIRLLKNMMGLWPLQQCKNYWQQNGEKLSYSELVAMAQNASMANIKLDLSHESFFSPGNMPDKINQYLKQTNQQQLSDKGQIVRAILDALAEQYNTAMLSLENLSKKTIDTIHIVGGGIQNELLCQLTANQTAKKIIAGPIEASASGNIIMQAIACGQIKSLQEGRNIILNSFETKEYLPQK